MISVFHCEVKENGNLLVYYAVSCTNCWLTFRNNLLVPSSRFKNPRPLSPKMSVRNYHCSLHNNPEECISLQNFIILCHSAYQNTYKLVCKVCIVTYRFVRVWKSVPLMKACRQSILENRMVSWWYGWRWCKLAGNRFWCKLAGNRWKLCSEQLQNLYLHWILLELGSKKDDESDDATWVWCQMHIEIW
jgi:hypothetical protein